MQDKSLVYDSFKRLIASNDWKVFENHIKETIAIHKDMGLTYIGKDRQVDGQRQVWIADGLLEAIEEPKRFTNTQDMNPINLIKKGFEAFKPR